MALAQALLDLLTEQQTQLYQVLLVQHPDAPIFQSLPGAGDFLAPALLAMLGEDRRRFPHPESLQSLAGTCPVTHQSGRDKTIRFRTAGNKEFRHLIHLWMLNAVKLSPWSQAYFDQVRTHSKNNAPAYRILGNRWLAILGKLWQDHKPYDPAFHLQQRLKRFAPLTLAELPPTRSAR